MTLICKNRVSTSFLTVLTCLPAVRRLLGHADRSIHGPLAGVLTSEILWIGEIDFKKHSSPKDRIQLLAISDDKVSFQKSNQI